MKAVRNNKGFTLIELMIVVVIIGILAALAIPRFTGAATQAKQSEAEAILKQVYTLQEAHFERNNTYAANATELAAVGYTPPPNLKHFTVPVIAGNATGFTACMPAVSTGVFAMTIAGTRPTAAATDGQPTRLTTTTCP